MTRAKCGKWAYWTATIDDFVPPNVPPVAHLDGDELVNNGDNLFLDASDSYDADGSITYSWDLNQDMSFGDGGYTTSSLTLDWSELQSYGVTAGFDHSITVQVTDDEGQTATATVNVGIVDLVGPNPPIAILKGSQSISTGDSVSLDAQNSHDPDANGTIVEYSWDFDDDKVFDDGGYTAGLLTLTWSELESYGFESGSTQTISVRVTDDTGATDIASLDIDIASDIANYPPTARIHGGEVATDTSGPLSLDASESHDPDGDAMDLSFSWDLDGDGTFGDGGYTQNSLSLDWEDLTSLYGFSGDNNYRVAVQVTDAGGTIDVAYWNVDTNGVVPEGAALGADWRSFLYVADGAGGFNIRNQARFAASQNFYVEDHTDQYNLTTNEDYIELAWESQGAAWNLNWLEQEVADIQESFTNAFIDVKTQEILRQIGSTYPVDVVAPSFETSVFENLTGTVLNAQSGSTVSFDVQFTGDGMHHTFDLHFKDQSGVVYGAIPVSINGDYHYDVDSVDPDDDPITYSLLPGTDIPLDAIDPQTGLIDWTPDATGDYDFVIQATDGRGGIDVQRFTLTVDSGATNNAPEITSVANTTAAEGHRYTYAIHAHDVDDDELTYLLEPGVPSGMTIDSRSGVISWTPSTGASQSAPFPISIKVIDGRGGEATQQFEISVTGDAPNSHPDIVTAAPTAAVVGQRFQYRPTATDAESDSLTWDLPLRPPGMAVNPQTGRIVWIPNRDQSGQSFTAVLRVRDGHGGYDSESFQMTVASFNQPPEIVSTPPQANAVHQPWQYQVVATDPNGDPLHYQLDLPPVGMTISPTGLIDWQPAQQGDYDTFDIIVSDGRGGSAVQHVTLSVQGNSPPFIDLGAIPTLTVGESWPQSFTVSDPDSGDSVTLSLDDISRSRGIVLDEGANELSWTPTQTGTFDVALTARDNSLASYTASFTLTVNPKVVASLPPELTSVPTGPGYVDEPWEYVVEATDPDGDDAAIVYELVAPAAQGNVSFDPNDPDGPKVSWTPQSSEVPNGLTFTVRTTDEDDVWREWTFTVPAAQTVPPANRAPYFTAFPTQIESAVDGELYQFQATAIDPDGDTLTYRIDSANPPAGMVIDTETGLLTWALPATGDYNITLVATDESGLDSDPLSFTIHVDPSPAQNEPPRLLSFPAGPSNVGQIWEYAVQAIDPDGDDAAIIYELVAPTAQGNVDFDPHDPDGPTLSWTPQSAEVPGGLTFTIRGTDEGGAMRDWTFTVPAVEAPPANYAPYFTAFPTQTAVLNELFQYQAVATDPDGDDITFHIAGNDAPAGMTIDTDTGLVTWLPQTMGTYHVSLVAIDDHGNESEPLSLTLPVTAPQTLNQPPAITSEAPNPAVRDRQYRYQPIATDPEYDNLTWSLTLPPELGGQPAGVIGDLAFDETTGKFEWTPAIAGTFSFTISVSDPSEATAAQSFDLVVLQNAPPLLTRQSLPDATLDQPYSVNLTASDPNDDDLSWSIVGLPPNGMTLTETIEGTAALAWTAPTPAGVTEVTVRVDDGELSDQYTFSLRVVDPNPANNTPPEITQLIRSVQVGRPFQYQVQAVDAEGDPLTFNLPSGGPSGLILETSGSIDWTPASSQAGLHSFVVEVNDGNGHTAQATFELTVIAEPSNRRPQFATEPQTTLVADRIYRYDADAVDPDGDSIRFSLVAPPNGMTIDAVTGRIEWTPTLDDLGQYSLTIRVTDALGLSQDQTRTLTVTPVNRAPMFGDSIRPWAVVGEEYQADVIAVDPDGHAVTYALDSTNAPGTITVMPDGHLTWTPPIETPPNSVYDIYVNAVDELGAGVQGWFRVQVLPAAPNNPPRFTNDPLLFAEVGTVWTFDADVVDPDPADTVTFQLKSPDPLSTTLDLDFDSTLGKIDWTPDSSLIGQTVAFELWADDGHAGTGQSKFSFSVLVTAPNTPPQITSVLSQTVTAGTQFRLDIQASDNQPTPLKYDLDANSENRGLLLDTYGRLTWNPTSDDIGTPLTDVTVTVTDDGGLTDTVMFDVTVEADSVPPTVGFAVSSDQAAIGSDILIRVSATDEVGIANRTLTLVSVTSDGETTVLDQFLPLDDTGFARLTLTDTMVGTIRLEATATDPAGNVSSVAVTEITVTDPADQSPPTVSIAAPGSLQTISAPTDIIGSVHDDETQNLSWTLTAAPIDGGKTHTLASGNGEVDRAVLARLDTTLLRNGFYRLTLAATDSGGNTSTDSAIVQIEGGLKLGNLMVSFTDLELPVSGLPIAVTRTYDTLDADVQGDFGYGWSLDIATTKVTVDFGREQLQTGNFGYTPFQSGTRVLVTLPDGSTEGFTFTGQPVSTGIVRSPDETPTFIPDPGVSSELIVQSRYIRRLGSSFTDVLTGREYTPIDPQLGGFFTLRLRNGTELVIDARNGDLLTATDRLGNTLTFTGQGIEHSAGRGVEFQRDYAGRITALIDPAGNRITYDYDALGNLISVTDRAAGETTFTYLDDSENPHYLESIHDPFGRPAATTVYDDQGRIKTVTDSDGKIIEYSWNGESKIQHVTDQLGRTTTITTDARGNVVREDDPSGGIMLRTYDTDDNLLTETTVVGLIDSLLNGETDDLTTSYTYDEDGNQLTVTDPLGNVTRTTYNTYGQPTSVTRQGLTTTYAYDNSGLLSRSVDPNGIPTIFKYDDKGNLKNIINDNGLTLVTSTYNSFGDVISTSAATGRTSYFDYDLNGNQVASWYMDGVAPDQVQVLDITQFDDANRIVGTQHAILPYGEHITQNLATATIPTQYVLTQSATTYNAAGQVETQVDQNGFVTETTYDLRGQSIQTRRQTQDENGQTAWLVSRTVYDAAGQAVVSLDEFLEGTGETVWATRSTYDPAGRVTNTERLKGVIVDLIGTAPNQSTQLTNPGTVVWSTSTAYDNAGRMTSSTDRFGAQTLYTYNNAGQQVETRTQVLDETGTLVWRVTRMVYDNQGRVQLSTDPYIIAADGQDTVLTPTITGSQTLYDDQGQAIETRQLHGVDIALDNNATSIASAGTVVSRSQTIYDDHGRVQTSIDPAGRQMTYEYDDFGRRVATLDHPVDIDGVTVRHRTETHYDTEGRAFRTITGIRQFTDGITDDTDQRITEYAHDAQGRQIETISAVGTPLEQSTQTQYDDQGRVLAEINPLDLEKTYEYDNRGQLAAVLLPAVPDPNNSNQPTRPRYEYDYDARGQTVAIRDPLYGHTTVDPTAQRETTFTFDERGNQLSRTLPAGSTETFEYDDFGRQTLHVSFEGIVTQMVYDDSTGAGGRIGEQRFFDNLTQYDAGNGTPSERQVYAYDALGRQISITHHRSDGSQDAWSTTYDADGRMIRQQSPQGTVNHEYDLATGNLVRTFTGTSGTYQGDQSDPINDIRYTYDVLGRLATVEVYERNDIPVDTDPNTAGNQPESTAYAYDLLGNLDAMTTPDGVITDYIYDILNRLDEQIAYRPDSTPADLSDNDKLAQFDYTVREDGNRTAAVETFWYDDNDDQVLDPHTNNITWNYDDLGRLTDEVFNHYGDLLDQSEHFTYDLTGNRTQKTLNRGNDATIDESTVYTFDHNDRMLTAATDTDGDQQADNVTIISYTGTQQTSEQVTQAGTLTSSTTYGYDLQGRLAVADVENFDPTTGDPLRHEQTSYEYNPAGIRVAKLTETDANLDGNFETRTRSEYLIDDHNHTGYQQVLQETVTDPATGEIQKRVVYTIGHDVFSQTTFAYTGGTVQSEQTLVLHADGHGSTRVLTDLTAAIVDVADVRQVFHYSAYGLMLGVQATEAATTLLYSGEQFDANIGKQYLRARYYDPATGTFNRLDPFAGNLRNPQSLHKYLYTHANPINGIDPSGMSLLRGAIRKILQKVVDKAAKHTGKPLGSRILTSTTAVYILSKALIGTAASYTLGEAYIFEMGRNPEKVYINRAIARKDDDGLIQAILDNLPGYKVRPDIQDLTFKPSSVDYYEIKAEGGIGGVSGRRQGLSDLTTYDPLMQIRYPGARRGTGWNPGMRTYMIRAPYGIPLLLHIQAWRDSPGLILYRSNGDEEAILKAIILAETSAQFLSDVAKFYSASTATAQGGRVQGGFGISSLLAAMGFA